jgi:hypothetical protein
MPFARDLLCTLINTKSCFVQRLCNDKKTTQGFIAILATKHSHCCMLLAFTKSKALSFYLVEPLYIASYKISQLFCSRKQSLQKNTFEKLYLKLYLNVHLGRKIRLQAPSDLQPHYGNEVFGNVYLLLLDNIER